MILRYCGYEEGIQIIETADEPVAKTSEADSDQLLPEVDLDADL